MVSKVWFFGVAKPVRWEAGTEETISVLRLLVLPGRNFLWFGRTDTVGGLTGPAY